MTRNVNLITGPGPHTENTGFDNIPVENINNIYSCSIDVLTCPLFSLFDPNIAMNILYTMLDKIKPKGQLVLSVTNLKRICKLYSNGNISDKDFFAIIKNTHNPIQYNDIVNDLKSKPNFIITNLKKDDLYAYIIITKVGA